MKLNPFATPELKGSELIADALSQFEGIAVKLETGVRQNEEAIAANDAFIAAKKAENDGLFKAANKGLSVATKLRALIS
jgi:hypothetical protein